MPSRTAIVNRAREEFLAGPGLAEQQYRCVGARHLAYPIERVAAHGSGEIVVGFSTANAVPRETSKMTAKIEVLLDEACDPLYEAVVECTEEAIVNALCMAEEMRGQSGHVAPALPLDKLTEILRNYRKAFSG